MRDIITVDGTDYYREEFVQRLLDKTKSSKRPRDTYPTIVDMRFVINNSRDVNELKEQIAEAANLQIGFDPFGIEECVEIMQVTQGDNSKPSEN